MKAIIQDISELSDSKEVYESRPNIFFSFFIYLVLALLGVAIAWMNFGKIDIVIKSEGMIRPNEQISTVINKYSGVIEDVNISDGQLVEEGELLYEIDHQELLTEKEFLLTKKEEIVNKIHYLNIYKKSIEEDNNYFKNTIDEEEYYIKFLNYYVNYETLKNNHEFSNQDRSLNLETLKNQKADIQTKLNQTEKLKKSIYQGENLFSNNGVEKDYYNLFNKYQNDYNSISQQYSKQQLEISSVSTGDSVENTLNHYNEKLEGLNYLFESIESEEDVIPEYNIYSKQYYDYLDEIQRLNKSYEEAKENYEANKSLEDLGVSTYEVKQAKELMEKSYEAINTCKTDYLLNLESQILEIEKQISDLNITQKNTIPKNTLLENNVSEKEEALKTYKLNYIIDLETKITNMKETLKTINNNVEKLNLEDGQSYVYADNDTQIVGSVLEYKTTELQRVISEIESFENSKKELETNILKIDQSISTAVVKAKMSGVINSNIELVKGDLLGSGSEVLTIIPADGSKFKVNIYVNNANIGKISEGMDIKCNIYALPNTEYGYITGKITKISKDIKVDENNTSGYYLVEASLDNTVLYDDSGNKTDLKVGMGCQAQIITDRKSILTFVLEKLNLWS